MGFNPPLSGILSILRLRVTTGLYDDKHACNDVGEYIIHAYMRLLSDMTLYIKRLLIQGQTKDRHSLGINYVRRDYIASLATQEMISCKEMM